MVLLSTGKLLWALLRLAQILAQVLVAVRVEGRSWKYELGVVLRRAQRYELVLVVDLNTALYILPAVTVQKVLNFETVAVQCWASQDERVADPN